MTCIAGLVHKGKVYIGGDSAGVYGLGLVVRSDEKVFRRGEFLMGFTSSFRMGQLLRFSLECKQQTDKDDYAFMCTKFIDAVRACLKAGGYATMKDGAESGGGFLVGYRGSLYEVCSDYQVGILADGYAAIGCGEAIAQGSLYSTAKMPPKQRILTALRAAERHSAGVRGPFLVMESTHA